MSRADRRTILFATAVLALILGPGLFTGHTFFARDLHLLWHPWKSFASEELVHGRLPLWNPYAYSGMPFEANFQSSIFYPGFLAHYFLPFPWALKASLILHYLLAVFGMAALARQGKAGTWAGLGAGLTFAFGGFLLTRLEFPNVLATVAWIPYGFLCWKKRPVVLGLVLTLSFLAGYPQIFLLFGMALFLKVCFSGKVPLKNFLLAVGFFMGLCALQWLPGAELTLQSQRMLGLGPAEATLHSFSWRDAAAVVFPSLAAASDAAFTGEKFYWATTAYVGLAAFCLALMGFWSLRKRPKDFGFLFVFLVLGFALAAGKHTPVYPLLTKILPIRYPGQCAVLAVFALAAACGIGLRWLGRRPQGKVLAFGALLILSAELAGYGRNTHPVLPNSFFAVKNPLTLWLQKNLAGERFYLSPRAQQEHRAVGENLYDVWVSLHNAQRGLSNMSWHLRNVEGTGEPLVPLRNFLFARKLAETEDWKTLAGLFRRAGVRAVMSPEPLPDPAFRLELKQHWCVSRVPGDSPRFTVPNPSRISVREERPDALRLTCDMKAAGPLTIATTRFPGWKFFVNGRRAPDAGLDDTFATLQLDAGTQNVRGLYRPWTFFLGLLLSLTTLSIAAFRALKILRFML